MELIRPQQHWIDLEEARRQVLPDPWPHLRASGFHLDLYDRAAAYWLYCLRHEASSNVETVLQVLGQGFLRPFSRDDFLIDSSDPHANLKSHALQAVDELSDFYGDRVSAVIWRALAHLAHRSEPETEKSILQEAAGGTLPHHYTVVDAALHAVGLVYTFQLHVNSVMFRHTGRILVHNCDCSCSLVNLEQMSGTLVYSMPRGNVVAASQSALTHFLGECWKLQEAFLPFALSITPEAAAIKRLL